ncbi:MAG: MFS transporter [Kofleriaceae bacterium]
MQPTAPIAAYERRIVWLVALVQLINILDFMMVMPLGPDFAKALGFAESDIGFIGGAYTAAAAVAGLVGAQFLDRFDRRVALGWALAGLAMGTALGGLAQDLPTLVGARVVAGIFGGPATALSLAIIADVVPPERRGRAMGIVMAGFSVASVLGVPIGLVLARVGTWRTPFFGIGGAALVVTVVVMALLPPLREHLRGAPKLRTRALTLLRRPELRLALAANSLLMLSIFALIPNLSAYIQHNMGYPRDRLELLYLAGGTASFLVIQLAGRGVDRLGAVLISVLGAACMITASACGFAVEPALLPVVVIFILFMCSGSLRSVAMTTLVSRLPAPAERAQYMSLQSGVQHISSASAAVLSSQLLHTRPDGHLVGLGRIAWASIALAAAVPVLVCASSASSIGATPPRPRRRRRRWSPTRSREAPPVSSAPPLLRLATCRHLPEVDVDMAPLTAALEAAGVPHAWVAWDDPSVDWDAPVPTVVRSTWNYAEHPEAFLAWCARVDGAGGLANPPDVIAGNLHKRYLLDLAARGVPAVPTLLCARDATLDLGALGWPRVVLKPAIGAGSRGARAFRLPAEAKAAAAHLATWAARGDVLVQPFVAAVEDHGERSLVWIDGELTHAIRKAPRLAGDVEQVTGPHPIDDAERATALAALQPVRDRVLYARVDLARDPAGVPMVMELELIEPSLFFPHGGQRALSRYVDAVVRWARARRR